MSEIRYIAEITRVADGVTRRYEDAWPVREDDEDGPGRHEGALGSLIWCWEIGNNACDCVRGLHFARVAGEYGPDLPCGDGAYRVELVLEGGQRIPIEEEVVPVATCRECGSALVEDGKSMQAGSGAQLSVLVLQCPLCAVRRALQEGAESPAKGAE